MESFIFKDNLYEKKQKLDESYKFFVKKARSFKILKKESFKSMKRRVKEKFESEKFEECDAIFRKIQLNYPHKIDSKMMYMWSICLYKIGEYRKLVDCFHVLDVLTTNFREYSMEMGIYFFKARVCLELFQLYQEKYKNFYNIYLEKVKLCLNDCVFILENQEVDPDLKDYFEKIFNEFSIKFLLFKEAEFERIIDENPVFLLKKLSEIENIVQNLPQNSKEKFYALSKKVGEYLLSENQDE